MESTNSDTPPPSPTLSRPAAPARRPWRTLLLVLLIGGGLAWVSFRVHAGFSGSFSPTLPWQSDSDEALARAATDRLPVLMVFTSPRCVYCRRLEKLVLERPAFEQAAGGRVVLAMLDIESATKHLRLLRQFGGSGTPTVVLTDFAGRMLDFYHGDGADLPDWLAATLNGWASQGRRPAGDVTTKPGQPGETATQPASS